MLVPVYWEAIRGWQIGLGALRGDVAVEDHPVPPPGYSR